MSTTALQIVSDDSTVPSAFLLALVDRDRAEAQYHAGYWAQMERHYREVEAETGWVLLPVVAKKKRGGAAHRIHRKPVRAAHDPASPFRETVDAKQVAAALNCSVQRLYALAAAGRLPHHRDDGRLYFYVLEILEYQKNQKVA